MRKTQKIVAMIAVSAMTSAQADTGSKLVSEPKSTIELAAFQSSPAPNVPAQTASVTSDLHTVERPTSNAELALWADVSKPIAHLVPKGTTDPFAAGITGETTERFIIVGCQEADSAQQQLALAKRAIERALAGPNHEQGPHIARAQGHLRAAIVSRSETCREGLAAMVEKRPSDTASSLIGKI